MKKMVVSLLFICPLSLAWGQSVPKETGSNATQQAAQEALDHHNKAREDVGTNPLEWSIELAAHAQQWANELARRNCAFEHRPGSGPWSDSYGENIFWGSASSFTLMSASESWYSEINEYKHRPIGETPKGTGHYTQMVWKNTTHVGIGIATCKNGEVLIVANYNPPGNWVGEKAY